MSREAMQKALDALTFVRVNSSVSAHQLELITPAIDGLREALATPPAPASTERVVPQLLAHLKEVLGRCIPSNIQGLHAWRAAADFITQVEGDDDARGDKS